MPDMQTNRDDVREDVLTGFVLQGKVPELLKRCKEKGYTRIAINTTDQGIPASQSWCRDDGGKGSIFAWPATEEQCLDGPWPALWRILEDLEFAWGCGNSHQHQITPTAAVYITSQVWYLVGGEWKRQK